MTGDRKPSAEDMDAAIAALSQHGDPLRPYQVEAVAKAIAERVNREIERRRVAWQPIASYPREAVPLGADPADACYWGPNVLLFVPTGQVAPASDYRILTGRLEADMWLGW